jgi:hypothetical protein
MFLPRPKDRKTIPARLTFVAESYAAFGRMPSCTAPALLRSSTGVNSYQPISDWLRVPDIHWCRRLGPLGLGADTYPRPDDFGIRPATTWRFQLLEANLS